MAGKEVLLKSVAQSIPAYVMSCFEIPMGTIKAIHRVMARFWWGDTILQRKIHWSKWETMCKTKHDGGLGFRDLHAFNLALLAKQGWRVLRNPSSLVAQVLKALYFPNDSFMNAKIKSGCSFVWRSIISGRRILDNGIRYRVGNGASVAIWKDKWIPRPFCFKPFTRPPEGKENMLVSELINSDDKSWDLNQLVELFDVADVDQIASISIARTEARDELVWHYENKGLYSVKTGYWSWRNHPTRQPPSSSSHAVSSRGSLGGFWKVLWKLKVPGKIKLFTWKLMHGFIPTKTALAARHVVQESLECEMCNKSPETINHLFRQCSKVRCFWKCLGIKLIELEMEFKVWYMAMLEQLSTDGNGRKEVFVAGVWTIWFSRNQIKWNDHAFEPCYMARWLLQYLDSAKATRDQQKHMNPREKTKWICPPRGRLKLNVDGAYDVITNMGGIGIIARDDMGVGVAIETRQCRYAGSAFKMELEACRWGLRLGADQGWKNVIIESDSILAVNALNSKEEDLSDVGILVADCKHLLRYYESASICHSFREANRAADLAAKLAKQGLNGIWFSEFPASIQEAIEIDLSNVVCADRSHGMYTPRCIAFHSRFNNIAGSDLF